MENGGMALDVEDDKHSILGDSKNKILGQMKNQFNNSSQCSSSENELQIDEEGSDNMDASAKGESGGEEKSTSTDGSESDSKPPIIVSIHRKDTNNKMTTRSAHSRHADVVDEGPKRSTRRRSKDCNESVLQSAIARKEKSYNETSKPQRLTRQLKPTQKILDNIASAAALKDKCKSRDGNNGGKKRKSMGNEKKRKCDSSVLGMGGNVEHEHFEPKCRRSGRLTSLHVVHACANSESDESDDKGKGRQRHGHADGGEDDGSNANFSSHLDADSATAQLIASRLCVCESPTKYTPVSETSIYCNALDSINDRLIGCNNSVRRDATWMLRPSTRVPYMVLCSLHRQRLQQHHCCAMCGVFCTQGGFLQCINKHLYHRNCKLSIGDLECCPHCGATDKHTNITITMETDTPLVYTAAQSTESNPPPLLLLTKQAPTTTTTPPKKKPAKRATPTTNNQRLSVMSSNKKIIDFREMTIKESGKQIHIGGDEDVEEEIEVVDAEREVEALNVKKEEEAALIICHNELEELEKLEQLDDDALNTSGENKHDIHELFAAIKKGLYAEVATLLGNQDLNLNQLIHLTANANDNEPRATVLHYAASHGLVPIMHMLKIADMNLNTLDDDNNTPLMVAVSQLQNDAVKYLTTAGACVTTKGTDGMTALHLASKCGNLVATKELLRAAAHIKGYINCPDEGGWTPLVWACEHNNVDIVKFLLSEEADPQLADVEGNVALHWAAFSGSIAIVELILNFGGNVDSVNDQGDTPLHIAARQDNYNCVTVFVTRGANFDIANENGETPLDCCPAGTKSHQTLLVNSKLKVLISNKK